MNLDGLERISLEVAGGLLMTMLLSMTMLISACGGRETGMVQFDPDPAPPDGTHDVEYHAGCQSGAECMVTFLGPEGRQREIFGSQWSHRFHAVTGQVLYLGVTVRRRCTGSYRLGNLRCRRAGGSARVAVFVDGERVASEVGYSRDRGVIRDVSFGVSVEHRIVADTGSTSSP